MIFLLKKAWTYITFLCILTTFLIIIVDVFIRFRFDEKNKHIILFFSKQKFIIFFKNLFLKKGKNNDFLFHWYFTETEKTNGDGLKVIYYIQLDHQMSKIENIARQMNSKLLTNLTSWITEYLIAQLRTEFFLHSKHVLKVFFKPSRKNQDFFQRRTKISRRPIFVQVGL